MQLSVASVPCGQQGMRRHKQHRLPAAVLEAVLLHVLEAVLLHVLEAVLLHVQSS